MTCILGMIDDRGGAWIAGDRALSDDYTYVIGAKPKVFRVGQWLFGCAGVTPQCERFRRYATGDDIEKFGYKTLAELMENAPGYPDALKETTFLAVGRSEIWRIESGEPVHIDATTCAVGSVRESGLAALRALLPTQLSPREALVRSLEIAAGFSRGIRPPFDVLEVEPNG